MATNKFEGITIEINGETTGLDKALEGVNSQAKSTQAELKAVDKALKLDPGNIELIEQKQRNLAAAVKATTDKLNILKEAQKQAQDQLERGEITQKQYDALTREISFTEAALRKANAATDEFNASLEQSKSEADKAADAAEKAGDKFAESMEKAKTATDKVASAAQTVADKTKALSAAAAGVVTAIGGAAVKAVKGADELETLSKQTGISTEELQKMAYASDLVDVSVDAIAGSMSKLRKTMASSAGAEKLEALGVAAMDANGKLRDSAEVFYEVLGALGSVGNETERDVLAMEIFGRSADQLAGIIDDGGASLKELGAEAESLGLIMDQETLDSLNEVNDSIDRLKAKATGEIAKTGAKAMEALTPVLDKVIEKLSALLDRIGNLDAEQVKTIATIAAVVAAISPIAGIIAGIAGAISTVLTIWPQVKAVGLAIKAFAAANPVLLIMTAVAALTALVVANWDKIRPILEAAWNKVKEIAEKIHGKIEEIVGKIKGVFEGLKAAISSIWDGIKQTIKDKINAIIGFINTLVEKVNGFLELVGSNGIVQGIAGIFGMKLGQLKTIPLMADGGTLMKGSAIVGEGGPELLTMQNGQAHVQTIANTTNTYNTINQTSRQPVLINLVADGYTLAQALYDPLQDLTAAKGPALAR